MSSLASLAIDGLDPWSRDEPEPEPSTHWEPAAAPHRRWDQCDACGCQPLGAPGDTRVLCRDCLASLREQCRENGWQL